MGGHDELANLILCSTCHEARIVARGQGGRGGILNGRPARRTCPTSRSDNLGAEVFRAG